MDALIFLLDQILLGLVAIAVIVFSLVALIALFRLADPPSEAELRWLYPEPDEEPVVELYDRERAA